MDYKISDSEWPVMQHLSRELSREWNKNTVHTFLTRLEKNGLVVIDKSCTPHQYQALVKREDCIYQEKQSFLMLWS